MSVCMFYCIVKRTYLTNLNLMMVWYLSECTTERYRSMATPTISNTDSTVTYTATTNLQKNAFFTFCKGPLLVHVPIKDPFRLRDSTM